MVSKTGRRGREEAQTTADLGAINVEVDFDASNVVLPISLAGFGTTGIIPSEFKTHDGSRSAASTRTRKSIALRMPYTSTSLSNDSDGNVIAHALFLSIIPLFVLQVARGKKFVWIALL